MASFRYQHGDRPLEGYTIEHGVGRGGFGEVYYAVSDSGRQVALKAVQNYEEVELRGIGHCMNLKSPYLVSIFDVKHDEAGQPFVIMEFVSGPSLRQLLDESPEGLGTAKAAYFLREIAKGLTYLHDCGIVHRDLKPHNVFYEDGFVKIGDYSLSKVITTSHRSGHTMTVGTVHYMAPEISMGRYDHTVDVYALGVMLYEMLTGHPPFEGESVGEVLMKHMAGEVDVRGLEEPFASVVKKALAKDPADRYQSAEEMVKAVYGADHVQDSVTAFNPKNLSVVAQKVAEKVPRGKGVDAAVATRPYRPAGSGTGTSGSGGTSASPHVEPPQGFAYHAGRAAAQLAGSVGVAPTRWPDDHGAINDPLNRRRRVTLALITIFALSMGIMMVEDDYFGFACMVMAAISFGGAFVRKRIVPRLEDDSALTHRLFFGGSALVCSLPIGLMFEGALGGSLHPSQTLCGVLVPMFAIDWRVMTSPIRPRRVSLAPALLTAVIGGMAGAIFDGDAFASFGMAAGIALAIQVASPFDPVAARKYGPKLSWMESITRALLSVGERPKKAAASPSDVLLAAPVATKAKRQSPQLRLAALLLSLVPFFGIPIGGLQRLYVGKIGTGLLWLFTLGFLYIGQLVDVILIALGQFRDSAGRRVTAWTGNNDDDSVQQLHATPVNHYSSVPVADRTPLRLGSLFLNLLGGLLLLLVLIMGLVLAVDVPGALSAGVLDFHPVDLGLAHTFVDPWPRLVRLVIFGLTIVLAMLTIIVLVVARRGLGLLHMVRVILASIGIFLALFLVFVAFDFGDWQRTGLYLQKNEIAPAVEDFLDRGPAFIAPMVVSAVTFVGSIFMLAWPAKQPKVMVRTPSLEREPEVAQQ